MAVILETSIGELTIDLFTDERPKCCKNFLKLCKIKYYNFCLFHSVQRNLVAQTGDPTGTGRGGESLYGILYGDQAKYFDMEVSPRIKHKKLGTVSMVNNGHNMHGSQFFITLGENLDYLDNTHTVFGEVAEGYDVLKKLNEAFCDKEHRPYKDIRIYHTIIIDDPYDDPAGLEIPDRSPEPTKQQLDSGRIGADEEIDDFKGMTEQEVQELMEEREAKANAQILAMVGDLPDEDAAPPENVLFVCKLNPVTTDEDLEVIFSRFGTIVSCEVIRDHKTQESLQYAFIEFDNPQSCENAYFKMDNVLIDDRRIHVDFSQSVSKMKWKGKGKGVEYSKDYQKEEESFSSKFRVKDNTRKDNKYDLVFDDNEEDESQDKSKQKKKKQKQRRDSSSEEDNHVRYSEKKKQRRDSSSEEDSGVRYSEKKKQRRDSSSEEDSRVRYSDMKKQRQDSSNEEDSRPAKSKKKQKDQDMEQTYSKSRRSRSHERSYSKEKRHSRSGSPVRKKHRSRSRERSYEMRRSRSGERKSKDKYRDRSRSAEKKSKDKYRDRSRSGERKSKDKYRDRSRSAERNSKDKLRDRSRSAERHSKDKYRDRYR